MDTVKLIFKRQSRLYSFILLIISIAFGITSSVFAAEEKTNTNNSAQAQMAQQFGATNLGTNSLGIKNPGTDLWRDVRNLGSKDSNGKSNTNSSSTSQVKGYETGAFINSQGQEWRNFRMTKLVPYSLYILGVVLLGITLFRLIRGEIKLKAGRSGKKIKRFTSFQRTVHWVVAILFVILGFTGVLLTFGRTLLIPLIGSQAFGPIAGVGKFLHDYLGPVFAIALVVMIFTFFKGNFFKSIDLKWFLKGGGLIGKHVSAGRYNAGEKAWYWFAMIVGVVVVISGLILDFPYFVHTRTNLELSHMIHAISGIVILAASFGHIYMGTLAEEGATDAMMTGYCDENWAKEHHDLWVEELGNPDFETATLDEETSDKTILTPVNMRKAS